MAVLGEELRAWLGLAHPGMLAVTTPANEPRTVRTWVVRPLPGEDVLEIVILRGVEPVLDAAVRAGARGALTLVELPNYTSRSFKGTLAACAQDPDEAYVEERLAALGRALHSVGLPVDGPARMLARTDEVRAWSTVRLRVDAVYSQSPGAGAGALL